MWHYFGCSLIGMVKRWFFVCYLLLQVLGLKAQQLPDYGSLTPQQRRWVDSVFNSLSVNERIAQLFMVRVHPNLGKSYVDSVERIIRQERLGGIVLFQGGPLAQVNAVNQLQAASKTPLMVAMDGEWGLGMRMPDSTISYPYQMALGAVQDNRLIRSMGNAIAQDFKRVGINVNFAPVVDINNNPRNPVINFRSFGENKELVYQKAKAYIQGLSAGGVLSTIKHFPGHGDTDVDSHLDLPILNFSATRLDTLEMDPFRRLIQDGAPAIMVGHMHVPALDKTKNLPSSLSQPTVTGVLRKRFGFKGLLITDAMDMNGVVKYFRNGDADLRAVLAGNDILELSQNSRRGIALIAKAVEQKRITPAELEVRVKRILIAKYWLGLNRRTPVPTQNLHRDLQRPASLRLNQQLADASVTVLKSYAPIQALNPTRRTAVLSIGSDEITAFQQKIGEKFDNVLNFVIAANAEPNDIAKVSVELARFEQIIIALHDNRRSPRSNLNYSGTVRLFINELANMNSVICLFANPYTLAGMPGIEACKSIVVCYQNSRNLQLAGAKAILKEIKPNGKLPVSVNAYFRFNDGINTR